MHLRYAQPARGERELLCKGEEATVCRINSGKYSGMVERLQGFHGSHVDQLYRFSLFYKGKSCGFASESFSYHLLRYLSLGLARSMFPRNFVNAHEIRFFRSKGLSFAATYSDYVPDCNGVGRRREQAMQRYYGGETDREKLRRKSDKKEHALMPGLSDTIALVRDAGITPAHPEANYHLSEQADIIFFEVSGLDMLKAIKKASSMGEEGNAAWAHISLMFSAALKAMVLERMLPEGYKHAGSSFLAIPLEKLYQSLHILTRNPNKMGKLFGSGFGEPIKYGAESIYIHALNLIKHGHASAEQMDVPLPCRMDGHFRALMDDGSGPLLGFMKPTER